MSMLVAAAGWADAPPSDAGATLGVDPLTQPAGPMRVGEEVVTLVETAHPYWGPRTGELQLVSSQEIYHPGASYICPHFSRFELADGDYVIVRSPDWQRWWRYQGTGKGELGRTAGFWAVHIPGETAVIELYSRHEIGEFGYAVDRFARGFLAEEMALQSPSRVICGTDDTQWAPCYSASEATIYGKSRAVARLLINGIEKCTGWLLGSEGHLITNYHCIDSQSDASNTNFEFMAEGETCATDCSGSPSFCPGMLVANSATLVKTSSNIDYALVQLPENPTPNYGYFQLRKEGGVAGERIYLPQHPQGWGKRIAVDSTDAHDESGYAELDRTADTGLTTVWLYFADTQDGSSGAPVVAYSDHFVVAVHNGSYGCTNGNRGSIVELMISDLGPDLPNDSVPYDLTITKSGTGSGTVTSVPAGIECGSDCSESYGNGTVVTLTATPDVGSIFTGWSGGGCTGTGTCEVPMDAAKTVDAEFTLLELTVTKTGNGTCTVTSSPPGIDCGDDCTEVYSHGTVVTLTPVPDPGSRFVEWSGDEDCSDGQVTMTTDITCIAICTLIHTLTVDKTGSGTGTVTSSPPGINCGDDCEEVYDHGTVVTLTAVADPCSTFIHWLGGCCCTCREPCQVTIESAITVTADFTLDTDVIFVDCFETGDCSKWSGVVGGTGSCAPARDSSNP